MSKNEANVVFPVNLPSGGFLYDDPILRTGVVQIRAMTVAEEELLGSQKESDRVQVLDTIIKRCLTGDAFPYEKLLVTDKLFILFAIRQVSYGVDYSMKVKCEDCGTQFPHAVVFNNSFKVRVLTGDDMDLEPYTVTFPASGSVVQFRMLRISDEDNISRYGRKEIQRNAANRGDPTYSYRLATHIVSANGETLDMNKRLTFVRSLVGSDSAVFKNAIEEKQSGLRIDLEVGCPSCGSVMRRLLQFNEEFFRPSSTAPVVERY